MYHTATSQPFKLHQAWPSDSSSCAPPAASHSATMTASSDKEYDLYAHGRHSSQVDTDAAINIGESGTTSVKHVTVSGESGPVPTLTGGKDIEEIYMYGSEVTPSYYGWNGTRYHSNTGTSSRGTQEAHYNTDRDNSLKFATECPGEHKDHRDGDSLSNFGETPTTPSKRPRKEAMESERIKNTTQASNDRAYNEFVTHDEGTTTYLVD